jgi:hypothetical protein
VFICGGANQTASNLSEGHEPDGLSWHGFAWREETDSRGRLPSGQYGHRYRASGVCELHRPRGMHAHQNLLSLSAAVTIHILAVTGAPRFCGAGLSLCILLFQAVDLVCICRHKKSLSFFIIRRTTRDSFRQSYKRKFRPGFWIDFG